jgi:hypothetical protein
VERARLLIEKAQVLGEPSEDPLLLFSVLYGIWAANLAASSAVLARGGAEQFLARAEKQAATFRSCCDIAIWQHLCSIWFAESRKHYDQADPLRRPF